jgi:Kef-type K+ transport system membrane component KefB
MKLAPLLLQFIAILIAARVLGRLFRLAGQPLVIAEIAAGLALGPSVLGVIWPEGFAHLFAPASLPALGALAQLGLVFFMFLVGLEFDPRLLRGQVRASFLVSLAGSVFPLVLGAAVAVPLHATLAPPGVGQLGFALFLGTAMSITAFPVLARILAERRMLESQVGAMALAAAAIGDVVAWCLLALVVGIATATGAGGAWVTTALAGAYGAFVWLVLRPVLARLGPRAGSEVSTELVALVLLLVASSALVTEWIGVHALFGAFMVGAAMPREGGVARALAARVEDFVTVALLPMFFAYSGLRTELGLLDTAGDWLTCGGLIAVACAGKFGGTLVAARSTGLGNRDATVLGVLMNTRGLMELVVLNVGLDLGLISERLFTMMVVMAVVTTAITAPLVGWLSPAARALPEGVAGPEATPGGGDRPSPAPTLFETGTKAPELLICVSDPAAAQPLLRIAAALARGRTARLVALHLTPTERPADYLRADDEAELEALAAIEAAAGWEGVELEVLHFPSGDAAADIVRVAEARGVEWTLIGVHRSSLGRDSLGGVVGRVLREAPGQVGVLVDRGLNPSLTVGFAQPEADRESTSAGLVARLVRGGANEVTGEPAGALLVGPMEAFDPSPDEQASLLLVRGALEA